MTIKIKHKAYFGRDTYPVHITRGLYNVDHHPLHSHDFTELVIIYGGSGFHEVEGETTSLRAGDVFVLKGPEVHAFHHAVDLDLMNLGFAPQRLELPLAQLRGMPGYHALFVLEPRNRRQSRFSSQMHLPQSGLIQIEALTNTLHEEFCGKAPGREAMLTARLIEVIVWLSRRYESGGALPAAGGLLRVGAVLARIERDYALPLQLAALAQEVHMSPNTLLRLFHDAAGTSPIDYLLRVRVQQAARLLRDTALPMTQIASLCGFCDSNYLARQFRRVMGQPPSVYRRRSQALVRQGFVR